MLWLIITIVVCTYFIIKVIKEQSPEGQDNKIAKAIKPLEENVKFFRDAVMHKEPDLVENRQLDKLRESLLKVEGKYSRLIEKEKERKDLKKMLELTTDLRDYFSALASLKNTECLLVVDWSNKTAENYGDRTAEPTAKKEEIEEKFDRLLGIQ